MPKLECIAHRGGAGLWPENTMAAFEGAIGLGCEGIELDCHLTRDGDLVVVHDLGEPGGVIEARAPRLRDVIRLAKARSESIELWIELKTTPMSAFSSAPEPTAERVLDLLREEDFVARAIVVGFDWSGPARAKKLEPRLRTRFTTPPHADAQSVVPLVASGGADGWFSHASSVTRESVADAKARGLSVAVWTVNEEAEMRRVIAAGCDAICTDFPDRLRQLV
jgi:glycerophosphoryl diester phosphodiesterase